MSKDSSSPSPAADALSELAQQRRKQAEIESGRPRPDFIEGVDTSEVIFVFLPAAIPFQQLDVPGLNEALDSLYKLQIRGPDFSPLLATLPREQLAAMSETELMSRLVRTDGAILKWANGRFPLRDDFVPIQLISLNFEAIQVNVSGVSQVAEVIAKEVIELIWQLTGAKKKFADVENFLKVIGYGTITRLNLGYGPECLLNPRVMEFFDANMGQGKRYAASLGRVVVSKGLGARDVNAVSALDDLTLHVTKFDPVTGYSDESDIRFSITGASDYKSGRLNVTTTLPYEKHVELLTDLFNAVSNPP